MGVTQEDGTVVSRDAEHSTYTVATPTPEEAAFPPSGPAVEQTLAVPTESVGTRASAPAKTTTPKKDA